MESVNKLIGGAKKVFCFFTRLCPVHPRTLTLPLFIRVAVGYKRNLRSFTLRDPNVFLWEA